jgi:hypothetical protein
MRKKNTASAEHLRVHAQKREANTIIFLLLLIIIIMMWFVRLLALRSLLAYCASLGR